MYYKKEIARLEYPFSEEERISFIVEHNHRNGRLIREASNKRDLIALDYSEEDKIKINKELDEQDIKMLNVTRLDFVKILEELGVTWTNIKALMAQYPEMEKELTLCSNVYRGNELLNAMIPIVNNILGLSITPQILDEAFIQKCGFKRRVNIEEEEG